MRGRIDLNPLRAFDSDHPGTQEVMAGAPLLLDFLDADDAEHFAEVLALLDAAGVAYEIDPTLVRGLDYYTRTVFEFTSTSSARSRRSAAAGATTASSSSSAARRRPAWAGRQGSSGSCWPASTPPHAAPPVDLLRGGADGRRPAFRLVADARRAGPAAPSWSSPGAR